MDMRDLILKKMKYLDERTVLKLVKSASKLFNFCIKIILYIEISSPATCSLQIILGSKLAILVLQEVYHFECNRVKVVTLYD